MAEVDMEETGRTLQQLPVEVLEMILMKAVLERVYPEWEANGYKLTPDMYSDFALVWSEWHYRITTDWFIKNLKRRLLKLDPSAKFLVTPQHIQTIETNECVWGLATIDDNIYVLHMYEGQLYIFDSNAFTFRHTIDINWIERPRDMVSDSNSRCLFIVEDGGEVMPLVAVWMHKIKHNGKLMKSWDVKNITRNLSMTATGNVLVMCYTCLKEYNPDGDLMYEILVNSIATWQAVQLNPNLYVVCEGYTGYGDTHRMYHMDNTGQISKVYGTNSELLNNPVYLAVDGNGSRGCIFVADSGNHRVLLMNPKLGFLQEFLKMTGDFHAEPYRLLLDMSKGRLYVGLDNGMVRIYKIT